MVGIKICGINDIVSLQTAINYDADMVGFVFVDNSPRCVTIAQATHILNKIGDRKNTALVGLFVNADDDSIIQVLENIDLDYIQCHGSESPKRMAEIKANTNKKTIKAIGISEIADFKNFHEYRDICNMVLCDAKPPTANKIKGGCKNIRTGGHGIAIDWQLFENQSLGNNWMLAGGLNIDNIAQAIKQTKAPYIDLSSGVEESLGRKSPQKIRALLELKNKLA